MKALHLLLSALLLSGILGLGLAQAQTDGPAVFSSIDQVTTGGVTKVTSSSCVYSYVLSVASIKNGYVTGSWNAGIDDGIFYGNIDPDGKVGLGSRGSLVTVFISGIYDMQSNTAKGTFSVSGEDSCDGEWEFIGSVKAR